MREIVLDTETTGLSPSAGDRIVEIGCVELVNHIPTGQSFHVYLNPERPMSADAERVHGLSDAFLADKPLFSAIADALLDFIGEATLVIHNAAFDLAFLEAEFARLGRPPIAPDRVIDTLAIARRKNPGGRNSLDDLCLRYGIDKSRRVKHGALLDAEILAEVYLELVGGRQAALGLLGPAEHGLARPIAAASLARRERVPRQIQLPPEVRARHEAFVATLGPKAIWRLYLDCDEG